MPNDIVRQIKNIAFYFIALDNLMEMSFVGKDLLLYSFDRIEEYSTRCIQYPILVPVLYDSRKDNICPHLTTCFVFNVWTKSKRALF